MVAWLRLIKYRLWLDDDSLLVWIGVLFVTGVIAVDYLLLAN